MKKDIKQEILNNLPDTKQEADELLSKLWHDHIPRDPRDQFDKMMKNIGPKISPIFLTKLFLLFIIA